MLTKGFCAFRYLSAFWAKPIVFLFRILVSVFLIIIVNISLILVCIVGSLSDNMKVLPCTMPIQWGERIVAF